MHRYRFSIAAVLAALALPACSFVKGVVSDVESFFAGDSGPKKVSDLERSIERVYVNCEVSNERARAALDSLQSVIAADFQGDTVVAYKTLEASIERSEEQEETLRETLEEMKDDADPVFDQWSSNLKEIQNVEMRQRSRNRMMETRERYDMIVATAEPALTAYKAVNQSLRDHLIFLGHDLNPSSVQVIREEAAALSRQVDDLGRQLAGCLDAARAYIDASAPGALDTPEEEPLAAAADPEADEPAAE